MRRRRGREKNREKEAAPTTGHLFVTARYLLCPPNINTFIALHISLSTGGSYMSSSSDGRKMAG